MDVMAPCHPAAGKRRTRRWRRQCPGLPSGAGIGKPEQRHKICESGGWRSGFGFLVSSFGSKSPDPRPLAALFAPRICPSRSQERETQNAKFGTGVQPPRFVVQQRETGVELFATRSIFLGRLTFSRGRRFNFPGRRFIFRARQPDFRTRRFNSRVSRSIFPGRQPIFPGSRCVLRASCFVFRGRSLQFRTWSPDLRPPPVVHHAPRQQLAEDLSE